MDIAERRLPQDGQFSHEIDDKPAAFRRSTLPVSQGDKAVVRLLQSENSAITLDKLGMPLAQLRLLKMR